MIITISVKAGYEVEEMFCIDVLEKGANNNIDNKYKTNIIIFWECNKYFAFLFNQSTVLYKLILF